MLKPQIPVNEESRLRTLHSLGVLDTANEERFDRLTRLAKRLFDVPIALVSLIDANRQWFKSSFGVDVSEAPRDISFCGHAILGNDLFIITDARADTRFSDNPLVTGEPYIRFYAGSPLSAPNGEQMGTLCIIDKHPRSFTDEDMVALTDLATMAERELAATEMATSDELTGISNRRGFMQLARHSINLALRQGLATTLVLFDLDNFKAINDTYGHAEGDRALRSFAEELTLAFRESDIFARLGGDEFVALLTNATQRDANNIVSRLQENLHLRRPPDTFAYQISFSCGILQYDPNHHDSMEELMDACDSLMYCDKKRSKP